MTAALRLVFNCYRLETSNLNRWHDDFKALLDPFPTTFFFLLFQQIKTYMYKFVLCKFSSPPPSSPYL